MRHSACSNASRSVTDGAPSPGIAGGTPRGAHCTATAAAAAVAKVVLACSAALCCRSPVPRIRRKCLPGVACLLAAEEALLHAPAASTTCPQDSRLRYAVDAADLQGERALRPEHVRRWDRTAKMRRAPSTAQSLRQSEGGAAAGHGTRALQWQGNSDRPSVAKVAVRRGVRWKRERCCFCCAID